VVDQFERSIPAAAEAAFDSCGSYGTAEAVPFQSRFKLSHYADETSKGRDEVTRQSAAVSDRPLLVSVVQSADLGHRHDRPDFRLMNGSGIQRVLAQQRCVLDPITGST
jgi:hypothetical protein